MSVKVVGLRISDERAICESFRAVVVIVCTVHRGELVNWSKGPFTPDPARYGASRHRTSPQCVRDVTCCAPRRAAPCRAGSGVKES